MSGSAAQVQDDRLFELRMRTEATAHKPKTWKRLAHGLLLANDLEGAEAAWRHAVMLDPNDAESRRGLGRLLVRAGRFQDAIEHLDAAARARPDDVAAWALLARALENTDDQAAAAEAWTHVVTLAPDHEYGRARLDWLQFCVARRADRGIGPSEQAGFREGVQHLVTGDAASAEAIFSGLVSARPDFAPAWAGLRGARHARGRSNDAAAVEPEWRAAAPRARAARMAAMQRPLSRRGLVFDPRDPVPLRSKERAMARANEAAELKQPGDRYLMIDPGGEPIEHHSVISLTEDGSDILVGRGSRAEAFVASLDNAVVVGRGAVVTQAGEALSDLHAAADKYGARRDGGSLTFDPATFFDGACSLRVFDQPAFLMVGPTDRSYGDWINNFPPRLALANAAGLDGPVVVRSNPLPQFIDMLAALGVDRERILFHDPRGVSIFPKLYVPSWPMADRTRPMKDVYGVYRPAARTVRSRERPLLYLSRQNVAKRLLVNEAEVAELFASKGFRVILPEDLTFDATLEVFANPACVAGPYGSALRNLVFCGAKPVCLVLMPPYPRTFQEGVALWMGEMGVRFAHVQGAAVAGQAADEAPNEASWIAPVDQLETAIDRLLDLMERETPLALG